VNWLRELARRLNILLHSRQFDGDLEEEMRLHLELRQQEEMESGAAPEDARTAAIRRFGNATYLSERRRRRPLLLHRRRTRRPERPA
jgi:hypothetical protein